MEDDEVLEHFSNLAKENPDESVGIITTRTLLHVLEHHSRENTIQGLHIEMKKIVRLLKASGYPVGAINSSGELFMRFISLTSSLDHPNFSECKRALVQRGRRFLNNFIEARDKIAEDVARFVKPGHKILVYSRSRVVRHALQEASKTKEFKVYVTQGAPDNSGEQLYRELKASGIKCVLIVDAAVGYIMHQVDYVMFGAESVTEDGGVINKLGTFTTAVCAKYCKKPVYVLAECFKFVSISLWNQSELSNDYKYGWNKSGDLEDTHPLVDYTPPTHISLLFTDLGIMPTQRVRDEIFDLYL